jgi:uncharacterized RDD family membrane protein YckC
MKGKSAAPGLLRRLASIAYDSLLLWGVLFLVSLPLPLIPAEVRQLWWVHLSIQVYLLAVCFLFFGGFWVHGGQTLGMRAWRLRVACPDGSPVTWRSALIRFFAAILSWAALGLGFLWILLDKQQLAWHDRLSNSRLVLIPKPSPS